MIRPETLRNPEQGLGLEDRMPPIGLPDLEPEEPEADKPSAPPRGGPSLRDRIAAARRLEARPEDGCRDCWTRGRDAALTIIEGEAIGGEAVETRLEQARTIEPRGSELHWRACWERGRDAALEVIEGR